MMDIFRTGLLNYLKARCGVSSLLNAGVDGGQFKQLTNFTSEQIFYFDFSRDGRQLVISAGQGQAT